MPRGVLLSGPPGCGKTLLARALAGEAGAGFVSVSASEFVEVFVGRGAARVRELFGEARGMAPAILFIDEIDAIGGHRAGMDQREHDQTLNQLLVEMDGFEGSGSVLVVGATNRPDMLDPALVRPGRFDRHVVVGPPDRAGRRSILDLHARGKRLAADADLDALAGLTGGMAGADLANVLNEAALLTARRGLSEISMAALEAAVDRASLGVGSSPPRLSEDDRRVVAYHEAGHGLVQLAMPGAPPPHKLTIVPQGQSLGRCVSLGTDRLMHSRAALTEKLAVLMAGRAAEELVFSDPGSGSVADLAQATDIARRMVCELGMSDALGPVALAAGGAGAAPPWSDESARLVDVEVRRLLEDARRRAAAVLSALRPTLDVVAEALAERETLAGADLERMAGPAVAGGDLAAVGLNRWR